MKLPTICRQIGVAGLAFRLCFSLLALLVLQDLQQLSAARSSSSSTTIIGLSRVHRSTSSSSGRMSTAVDAFALLPMSTFLGLHGWKGFIRNGIGEGGGGKDTKSAVAIESPSKQHQEGSSSPEHGKREPVEYKWVPQLDFQRSPVPPSSSSAASLSKQIQQQKSDSSNVVPIIAGNWKENPADLTQAFALASLMAAAHASDVADRKTTGATALDMVIFPPSVFLPAIHERLLGSGVKLGAQDAWYEEKGAFSGEMSMGMAKSVGCEYVLVGHSERRTLFGDTDAIVHAKCRAALDAGLNVILCIGENEVEFREGLVNAICAIQLAKALEGVTLQELSSSLTIAYEPVWAIGTGLSATPAIAQQVHQFIKEWLKKKYPGIQESALIQRVRVQYGGSVTPETAEELMQCPDINGCLIGGASLSADKFVRIVSATVAAAAIDAQSTKPLKLWAEKVVPCRNVLGESPIYRRDRGVLAWVDISGKELWEYNPVTKQHCMYALPDVVGCCAFREGGGYVMGFKGGIARYDPTTGSVDHVTDFENDLPTRPNDGRVSREGDMVVGSYNEKHKADGKNIAAIYRLKPKDPMALEEILDYRFRVSNCISFSPDGKTMYFTDSPTRRIFAFSYSPDTPLRNRRLVYEVPASMEGVPDGACVDARGNLWVAISGAGKVICIDTSSVATAPTSISTSTSCPVIAEVELPCPMPTSCTIGGPALDTLYITTRTPGGGALYACLLPEGVKGLDEPTFKEQGAVPVGNAAVNRYIIKSPTLAVGAAGTAASSRMFGMIVQSSAEVVKAILEKGGTQVDPAVKNFLSDPSSSSTTRKLTPAALRLVAKSLQKDSTEQTVRLLQGMLGLEDDFFISALLVAVVDDGFA